MDEIDIKLLSLLRQNARKSVAELAVALGVSRGTVTNRIAKLERNSIIHGYTVKVSPETRIPDISAWTSIQIEGNQARAIARTLLGFPEIQAVHETNGQWGLLVEIRTQDTAQLSRCLAKVRELKGVKLTETSIHLVTYR